MRFAALVMIALVLMSGVARPQSLDAQVDQLIEENKLAEAAVIARKNIEQSTQTNGPEHPNTATKVTTLALIYDMLDKPDESVPLFQQALAIFEKSAGPDHPDTAQALSNLGFSYKKQHNYDEAEKLFERALSASERAAGPNHPNTFRRVTILADCYKEHGKYAEAERLFKRAVALAEKLGGPKSSLKYLSNSEKH